MVSKQRVRESREWLSEWRARVSFWVYKLTNQIASHQFA